MNLQVTIAFGLMVLAGSASAGPKQKPFTRYGHAAGQEIRNSVAAIPPAKAGAAVSSTTLDAEDARYEAVKDAAKQDSEVVALKAKADGASGPEAIRQAMIDYNRALFRKMKAIDGSLTERVDLVEAAILKRIRE